METQEIINLIANAKKRTIGKMYLRTNKRIQFENTLEVYGEDKSYIIFGDISDLRSVINANLDCIIHHRIVCDRANSALDLLNYEGLEARVEPGAIIRDKVTIAKNAIIMMGAVINIGASVGENSMIDMNAVLGANAKVGCNVHVGAGAIISGVVEPPSAKPCEIGDGATLGANSVILEGVKIGAGAVVAASSVVLNDVPENVMVAGVPAKIVKIVDEKTENKTRIVKALRSLK